MRRLPLLLLAGCALMVALPHRAAAFERGYWSSLRSQPLSAEETKELERQSVGTLFWEVGELAFRGKAWHWDDPPLPLPTVRQRVVPVVRLTTPSPESLEEVDTMVEKLRPVFAEAREKALVIDFAATAPFFPAYTRFLSRLRTEVPALAATASANWIKAPAFPAFAGSVAEIEVRFDPFAADSSAPPDFAAWSHSPAPWRAIVPNFVTATVYDASGASRETLHDWSWDDLLTAAALSPLAPLAHGVVSFESSRPTRIAGTVLTPGERLTVVAPERETLVQSFDAARAAGAAGAVFFLPTAADESNWSLRQLGNLTQTAVELTVRIEKNYVVLTNVSGADLPPRCENGGDRGYVVEMTAPNKAWAEALPGGFNGLNGFNDPDEKEKRAFRRQDREKGNYWKPIHRVENHTVPPSRAKRLQFSFSSLRAGESLRSGRVRLRPEAGALEYRILPIEPEFKPLEVSQTP